MSDHPSSERPVPALSRPGHVRVALVDVLGREVAVVDAVTVGVGAHELQMDGRTIPTGVYVVRLRVDDQEVASIPVTVAR